MESCMNSDIEIKLCGDENDFKNLITRWNDLFKEYAGKKGDVKNYRVKPSNPKDIIISKCINKEISYERERIGFSFKYSNMELNVERNIIFVVSPNIHNNCVHEDEKNKTSITSYSICFKKQSDHITVENLKFDFGVGSGIPSTILTLEQYSTNKGTVKVQIVAKTTKNCLDWSNIVSEENLDNIFGLEVILKKFDYQEVFQNLQCFYNKSK